MASDAPDPTPLSIRRERAHAYVERLWQRQADRGSWYAEPLLLLSTLIGTSDEIRVEVGRSLGDSMSTSAAALLRIHDRGLLVAGEVDHLLRGGYPVGALAHSRTLYELRAVGTLIAGDSSGELAERWLAYGAVEKRNELEAWLAYVSFVYPDDEGEIQRIRLSYQAACQAVEDLRVSRFGAGFGGRCGWARGFVNGEPSIHAILVASGLQVLWGHWYTSQNGAVHASPRSIGLQTNATDDGTRSLSVGPSTILDHGAAGATGSHLAAITELVHDCAPAPSVAAEALEVLRSISANDLYQAFLDAEEAVSFIRPRPDVDCSVERE